MNKDKLVLKNGTEIELEAGANLGALQVKATDRAAMLETWDKLTEDNLSEVRIKNGADLTVGTYTGLVLISETSVMASDGAVVTTYALREKTSEERRLDALEAGQSVQDGAIEDLGAVTSTLAEQMEGVVE